MDSDDVILFVDTDYRIFELIYRRDLNQNIVINNPESIMSLLKKNNDEETFKIEISKRDQESLNSSNLDLSKNTDFFNISQMMQDTQHDISDIY